MSQSTSTRKTLQLARVDFPPKHPQPSSTRMVLVTAAAVIGSVLADALIVVLTQAIFPSTKGYDHFRFSDYALLTVVGVLFACLTWPLLTRISSQPRWLYSRLAVLVTIVLLIPDVQLLTQHQPTRPVIALMVMHVAIAAITYYTVTLLAPTSTED